MHTCPEVLSVNTDVGGAVDQVKTPCICLESPATTVSDNVSVCG